MAIQQKLSMKKYKISIIGTRGIPANYGGFETFAQEVATRFVKNNISTIVIGDSGNNFSGNLFNGIKIINSRFSKPSNPLAFYFDSLKISEREDVDCVIICGVGASMIIPFFKNSKFKIIMNPDGLGFKRNKYSLIQKILFYSQYLISSFLSIHIVCDSKGIQSYYESNFHRKKNISVIEYGTYINNFCTNNFNFNLLFSKFRIDFTPFKYHLVVSRLEPENNVEIIIKSFLKINSKYPLIVVGNLNTKHSNSLIKFKSEKIHFLGGIYDKNKLMLLRAACLTYLHGHSVGGTNPSLLEAMGSKNICICHDNKFNREVIGDNGLFFNNEINLSQHIIDVETQNNFSKFKRIKEDVFLKAQNYYNWDRISNEYINLIKSE